MSNYAIKVENLSKSYVLRHQNSERYTALRDVIGHKAKSFARRVRHPFGGYDSTDPAQEEFWALKDLNFEIKQGDRVGIIGRNGAGKSTLLKTLSRITEPTTGKISINGRVASLLEVGTGFHPELTGRENIFLNGAIMGMSKWEIKAKFDEIVAFAEVEKFLDTPVKRYSSGMYVRLAFAVAAHLEPEILIVDEVLAVGDAAFQKKCLGKMEDVGKEGRTVIFVSHNMGMIQSLCNKGIVLDKGQLSFEGKSSEAIREYGRNKVDIAELKDVKRTGNQAFTLTSISTLGKTFDFQESFVEGEELIVRFTFDFPNEIDFEKLSVGLSIHNYMGETQFLGYSDYMPGAFSGESKVIYYRIPKLPLVAGKYYISYRGLYAGVEADWPQGELLEFTVESGDFYQTGRVAHSVNPGFYIDGTWSNG